MKEVISTDRARQGRWGGRVLLILVASLFLVALAWIVAGYYGEEIKTPQTTEQPGQVNPPAAQPKP